MTYDFYDTHPVTDLFAHLLTWGVSPQLSIIITTQSDYRSRGVNQRKSHLFLLGEIKRASAICNSTSFTGSMYWPLTGINKDTKQ